MATFYNQATLSYNGTTTTSNITTGELVEVLSANKTAVVDSYASGDTITYVVNILNSGTTAFTGLTLTDDLGAYTFGTETLVPLTYVTGSVLYYNNGVLQATPTVTATDDLVVTGITVPAGGTATVVYEVATNSFAPLDTTSTIVNTASITGTGVIATVEATETVTAADAANLSITKALSPATVNENGQLTYTFVIQNTGNTAAEAGDNVVITDTFDPVLNPISVTYNGNTTWLEGTDYNYNSTTGVFTTVAGKITVPAATYEQDTTTGAWSIVPGVTTLVVTGTVTSV